MSIYNVYKQRATGLAFILAPLLMFGAAMGATFQIGINPGGSESQMDALLLGYAVILFVPVYFGLAGMLGKRFPLLALFCAVIGIVGILGGVGAVYMRFFEWILLDNGATLSGSIWDVTFPSTMIPMLFGALLFPLTPIILGVGLLRSDDVSIISAISLIAGGIFFFLGQAAGIASEVTYPLAGISWLVALAPLGLQMLQQPRS